MKTVVLAVFRLDRDGAYVTDPVLKDSSATYTPGVSERRGSATTFLHSGLKNADAQTGTGQTVSGTRRYDAFGNVVTSTGIWNGPFGYAGGFGYQEDATGLKLLGHRYYDSSTGRFLTRDPEKDGRNWYTYCWNDPVGMVDTDGQNPTGLAGIGAAVNEAIRRGLNPPSQDGGSKKGPGTGGKATGPKEKGAFPWEGKIEKDDCTISNGINGPKIGGRVAPEWLGIGLDLSQKPGKGTSVEGSVFFPEIGIGVGHQGSTTVTGVLLGAIVTARLDDGKWSGSIHGGGQRGPRYGIGFGPYGVSAFVSWRL